MKLVWWNVQLILVFILIVGGWISSVSDANQFLQIDFIVTMEVNKVHLRGNADIDAYVKKFMLAESKDGVEWITVKTSTGADKVWKITTLLLTPMLPDAVFCTVILELMQCHGKCIRGSSRNLNYFSPQMFYRKTWFKRLMDWAIHEKNIRKKLMNYVRSNDFIPRLLLATKIVPLCRK